MINYDDSNQGIRNMIMEAIRHIASYGFFLRDMVDFRITYNIESATTLAQQGSLFQNFSNGTLGMPSFSGTGSRSGTTLGLGDPRLLWSSLYGRGHMLFNGSAMPSPFKLYFSPEQLSTIENHAESTLQDDIHALYTVFEWSEESGSVASINIVTPLQYTTSINKVQNWRRISAISCLTHALEDDPTPSSAQHNLLNNSLHTTREELLRRIDNVYIAPNRLTKSNVEPLLADGWPLIIATDGGATTESSSNTIHRFVSASVVILHPPNVPYADYIKATRKQQLDIMNTNLLPWRARATPLPPTIGDQNTDNAHAECMAIILMEEWLPRDVPVLLIMDSEAERSRYLELRQPENITNRFMIRSLMSGVSKCLGFRLAQAIHYHQASRNVEPFSSGSNLFDFCTHANNWCYSSIGDQSLWKPDQWGIGDTTAIWAIRSHQLTESFHISPKNRYKDKIIPNRAFVSANQWADNVCNAILRFQRNATHSKNPSQLRRWIMPAVTLGITGPAFILTFNGKCIDRSVTIAVEHACDLEFVKRLAARPTQGLLLRLQPTLLLKPEMVGRQSYLRRSLEGKTKTHTRAMYVDSDYRKIFVSQYAKAWGDDPTQLPALLKSATKCYKYLRCPCCVTILDNATTDKAIIHPPHSYSLKHGAVANSGLYANLRHYRFYCLSNNICEVRHKMTQLLEDHLTLLLKIASQWGPAGFSTLLQRIMKGIITLDLMPFHNASSNNLVHRKTQTSHLACLETDNWIQLVESQHIANSSLARANFIRWPLVHQFAFIPANCYSELELQDGEYSPCDLISMGIIPMVMHDTIIQFAKELGARHSQDSRKQFLQQWQQVRAVALLRAISIAMAAGAHIADFKSSLLTSLPGSPSQMSHDLPPPSPLLQSPADSLPSPERKKRKTAQRKVPIDNLTSYFACVGISCSPHFSSKTNLRPSIMRIPHATCRRCRIIMDSIAMTSSIEQTLALNKATLAIFLATASPSTGATPDTIINAISTLQPLPPLVPSQKLQRSTKRNVYPLTTMTTARLLCGTFGWTITEFPTSLDLVFNQPSSSSNSFERAIVCNCDNSPFFTVNPKICCDFCGGISRYVNTTSRVSLSLNSLTSHTASSDKPPRASSISTKNRNARRSQVINNASVSTSLPASKSPHTTTTANSTNSSLRPPTQELQNITTTHHMLSNFVVSYFFKILAQSFQTILYTEFLFDFVKRDGGWSNFVINSTTEGHYSDFLKALTQKDKICIIPICEQAHWTILVRKFTGNAWTIFFADSLTSGSDQRLCQWKALFHDNDSFSGVWAKTKIIPQTELECGARACLHGLCLALSTHNSSRIMSNIARINNLAARSRTMVANICSAGHWHPQGWLKSILCSQQEIATQETTASTMEPL